MADQNYSMLLRLLLKDQLSGGLKKTMASLRGFDSDLKKVMRDYNQFRGTVSKPVSTSAIDKVGSRYRSATKEIRAFSREQGKMGTRMSRPPDTKGLDTQTSKLRAFRRELRAVAKESGNARTSMRAPVSSRMPARRGYSEPVYDERDTRRRGGRGFGSRLSQAGDFYMNARQAGDVWRDRVSSLDKYIQPARELLGARTRFSMMGWSPRDVSKGLAGAEQVSRTTRGVNPIEAQEAFNSLVNTIGSVDDALKFLPLASKYQANMKVMYDGQFS